MKATLLLCDAAQVDPAGKVHILGAGWTVVGGGNGVPLPAQAVVLMGAGALVAVAGLVLVGLHRRPVA